MQARIAGSERFDINMDRQQLADYLAMDRTTLSQEISRMRAEGLIECHRGSFRLLGVCGTGTLGQAGPA